MAQPQILCHGPLNFWVQKEWYRLTAVILSHKELYSLTLTKLAFATWLSNPTLGVILDMSLSSAVAMESASVGTMDGAFLILLFTKRSTHVLSAMSEQDRIRWKEKFEQIIGEEWKFKVTIPCQLELRQECKGVLRFNTNRRTIVITYTPDSSQLPSVLYHWTLKSIKSFGANQDLLVLGTSNLSETGKSYFCVNTPQAEDILRVLREATGVLPYTGNPDLGRNSARFADIDRVKRAIQKNNSRTISRDDNDDDDIQYEFIDEFEESNQRQIPSDNHGNRAGISNARTSSHQQIPVKYGDQDIHPSNQARMYRFPSSDPNTREMHSHIHSVPKMGEDMAVSQALKQRSNSPNFKDNIIRGNPQNNRKKSKVVEEQDTNPVPNKRRPRSRNRFGILSSGRNTPQGLDETSQLDPSSRASSRATSPHNFIYRAISKLRGRNRSRDNLAANELAPRSRSRDIDQRSTASTVPDKITTHTKLDRPLPPRHIPTQPSQPIIVQHPQPIEQTAVFLSQPSHFVPNETRVPSNQIPFSQPSQMQYNLSAECSVAINRTENMQVLTPTQHTQFISNQVQTNQIPAFSYKQMQIVPQNIPQISDPVVQQTAQWVQQQRPEPINYNKLQATVQSQLNRQLSKNNPSTQNEQLHTPANVAHHVIRTTSPNPVTNTSVISPPSGFKGTPNMMQQQQQQQQQQIASTPLQHSTTAVAPIHLTNQFVANTPDRDSCNYDHLSPEKALQALPDILQPTQQPVSSSGMQSPETKIPAGGQQTPLAFIQQQQQHEQASFSKSSPDRKLRRNEAFRTKQIKPSVPPKPTLSPNTSTAADQPISDQPVIPQIPITPPQTYPTTDC